MQRVLSTKLRVDQVDRFEQVAEAQGETKASLLKRMVLEYLQGAGKVDEPIPTSRPHQATVLAKGLHSEYPPHDPYQKQTEMLTSTPGVDSCLPSSARVDYHLNSAPLRTSGQPAYHNAESGKPITSPKQSSGIGWLWLILWGISVWYLRSQSVDVVDRPRRRLGQGIGLGVYR